MPYELSFTRPVEIADSEQYWNECCVGGDVVLDQLLPELRKSYERLATNQEDWGWFAWFEKSNVKLAVDIFTDDALAGQFRIHLTSRRPRILLGTKIEDTVELEELRSFVASRLAAWGAEGVRVVRLNDKYMPVSDA